MFNLIAGVFAPDTGRIVLDGVDITGLRPDQACHAGIGRTFQIVRPFGALTRARERHGRRLQGERRRSRRRGVPRASILERLGLADKADLRRATA